MSDIFCRKTTVFIMMRKVISLCLVLSFSLLIIVPPSSGQVLPNLPLPGQGIGLTVGFQPPVLRGMSVHPENPLLFDFIVDRGQDRINNDQLKDESTRLIKYFLASMTIPDKDAWVNLSPTEKDRIIPDALGQTEMGRQMLEQDYVLKQLAASLTNPDTELGRKYWDEVHRLETLNAQRSTLGNNSTSVNSDDNGFETDSRGNLKSPSLVKEGAGGVSSPTLNQFNKVWIVPAGATVVEKDGFAYITESRLNVMLDEEYENNVVGAYCNTPLQKNACFSAGSLSTKVFRKLILPKLIEEVNTGKSFAATRQVYQSVILAAWYKKALKDSLLGRIYADKSKIEGIETDVKDIKQKVYEQYLEAFKKGAYNVIKEELDSEGDLIPRKYFSGGLELGMNLNPDQLTVNRSSSAVNRVAAQINNAQDQIVLVAASGVETPGEADALAASSGVETGTGEAQVLAEFSKVNVSQLPPDLRTTTWTMDARDLTGFSRTEGYGYYGFGSGLSDGFLWQVEDSFPSGKSVGAVGTQSSILRILNFEPDIKKLVPEIVEQGNIKSPLRVRMDLEDIGYDVMDFLKNDYATTKQHIVSLGKWMVGIPQRVKTLWGEFTLDAMSRFYRSEYWHQQLVQSSEPMPLRGVFANVISIKDSLKKLKDGDVFPYAKIKVLPNAQVMSKSSLWDSLNIDEQFDVLIELAETFYKIHQAGVVVKGIHPRSVVVGRQNGKVVAMPIDFSQSNLYGNEARFNSRIVDAPFKLDIIDFASLVNSMFLKAHHPVDWENHLPAKDQIDLFIDDIITARRIPGDMQEFAQKMLRIKLISSQIHQEYTALEEKLLQSPNASSSSAVVSMTALRQQRQDALAAFNQRIAGDSDSGWWLDSNNENQARVVFLSIVRALVQQQKRMQYYFSLSDVKGISDSMAANIILALVNQGYWGQPVTAAQRVSMSDKQIEDRQIQSVLPRFNEILRHLGMREVAVAEVSDEAIIPDKWGEMVPTMNLSSSSETAKVDGRIWTRAQNVFMYLYSFVDLITSAAGQNLSVIDIPSLQAHVQSFADMDPAEIERFLILLGFEQNSEGFSLKDESNQSNVLKRGSNIYTIANMTIAEVRKSLDEPAVSIHGISAQRIGASWLAQQRATDQQSTISEAQVTQATEQMLVYLGLNKKGNGYFYAGNLETFDKSLKDREILVASSSIAQKVVVALVAAGLLSLANIDTYAQEIEPFVTNRDAVEITFDRGPLLEALKILNYPSASAEFKQEIRDNIHDLLKKKGNGLVPIYNEFDSTKPTVLFIHGATKEGGAITFIDGFKDYYQKANLIAFQFDESRPLEDIAKDLNVRWQAFKQQNNVKNTIVVAHSYGNVVLRQAVADDQNVFAQAAVVEVAPTHGGSARALDYGGIVSQAITALFGYENISKAQDPKGPIQTSLYGTAQKVFLNRMTFLVKGDENNPQEKPADELSSAEQRFQENFQRGLVGSEVHYLEGRAITHGNAPAARDVLDTLGELIDASASSATAESVPVASTIPVQSNFTKGGIDFDPSKLNLQIKRDGHGVPLPLPQQDLENININGLYPVILNILPVNAQTLPILGQLNVQPEVVLSKG